MSEQSKVPEVIWAYPTERQPVPAIRKKDAPWIRGKWTLDFGEPERCRAGGKIEYVTRDLCKVLIAGAFREAATYLHLESKGYPDDVKWCVQDDAKAILCMTPADAQAAYDAALSAARAEGYAKGLEGAASLIQNNEEFSTTRANQRGVQPRSDGNLSGLAYAKAILALKENTDE